MASTPVSWRVEEIEGDVPTTDVLLTGPREQLEGMADATALTASVAADPATGLRLLVISPSTAGPFPATVEEITGDADTDTVFIHIPRAAFDPDPAAPGADIAGFRVDRATGPTPIFVAPLGG